MNNTQEKNQGVFSKTVSASTSLVERLLPNAFVFAALLTPIVLLGSTFFYSAKSAASNRSLV